MTILLTGGTGFLGKTLVPALIRETHHVILYVRPASKTAFLDHFPADHWETVVEGKTTLDRLFLDKEIDLVIHLATDYVKQHSDEDTKRMIRANIEFPALLLQAMASSRTRFFINTGTFFEYDLQGRSKIDETHPKRAYNLYASTKASFEEILKYYTIHYGIIAMTLKLFAPFGPYDRQGKIIPSMIQAAISGEMIEVHSSGTQQWDYVYSEDVANAFLMATKKISTLDGSYHTFNIGTGETHSLRQIASAIESVVRKPVAVSWGSDAPKEIAYACANPTKANSILGWQSRVSFAEALRRTIDWTQSAARQKGDGFI